MNQISKSLLCLLLSLSLCLGFAPPALANETDDGYTATLNVNEVTAGTEQDVILTVSAGSAKSLAGIGAQVIWDDNALTLKSIENSHEGIDFAGSVNLAAGVIAWDGNEDLTMVEGVTEIARITFTVPAGIQPGEYTLGLKNILLADNTGIALASTHDATEARLTVKAQEITDPSAPGEGVTPEEGYSAGLSTLSKPRVDDEVLVSVNVSHKEGTHFAAGQLTIEYDNTKLRYKSISSQDASVTNNGNTLTLADYGADKAQEQGVYTLTFTAIADGDAAVTLTQAAFTDKESAKTEDLSPATLKNAELTVTIQKRLFSVTIDSGDFSGETTIEEGGTYTFTVANSNYHYSNVTATIDGKSVDVSYDESTNTYSVANVTGNLIITATRTPKKYDVTFKGLIGANDGAEATYGVDYHFTLPDNVPVNKTETGTNYSIESVTIGGEAFTGYVQGSSDRTYSIPGTNITGDIEITVKATTVEATHVSVTVNGTGAADAQGYASIAEKGKPYTLRLDIDTSFHYTVSATMGGENVALDNHGDGTSYTVNNVTGDLVFTVEKTFNTTSFHMVQYLSLGQKTMYLIYMEGDYVADGRIPTYDGEHMLWSETHGNFCYLVIADSLTSDAAKEKIGITSGEKKVVADSLDVNLSRTTDASDAQLVYNMYNVEYQDFSEEVTMEKFLMADTNHDHKIDTGDAVVIIDAILHPQTAAE